LFHVYSEWDDIPAPVLVQDEDGIKLPLLQAVHVMVLVRMGDPPPDYYGDSPLPKRPTTGHAGTEAKIRTMQRRFARRESLFHRGDAKDGLRDARQIRAGANGKPILIAIVSDGKAVSCKPKARYAKRKRPEAKARAPKGTGREIRRAL
jgi:hypothetical protein